MEEDEPQAILVTGTIGAGKTTVAEQIAELLRERGIPHGRLDLDKLGAAWPKPPDDPFHFRLTAANARDVWRNMREAGARFLVLSHVIETTEELQLLERAIDMPIRLFLLRVPLAVRRNRIVLRLEDEADRAWHVARTEQLDDILDSGALGATDVANHPGTARETAAAILRIMD